MLKGIPLSIVWLVIAVILGVFEASTMSLITIWFALGAVFSMIAALAGLSFGYQILVFIVSSGVLLYFTKPIVKKYLTVKTERTNADRVLHETGLVIERIDTVNSRGQVKVRGQVWSARSVDSQDIEAGEKVEVESISGVKLLVKRFAE